jgi:hypothetical protein
MIRRDPYRERRISAFGGATLPTLAGQVKSARRFVLLAVAVEK